MLRYTPLAFAAIVVEGDLRSRLAPARKGLVEEPDGRTVLVRGEDLQAPQGVPAPGPVADGSETTRRFVVGVTTTARLSGLQRGSRLIVDVLAALDARPDRIRQHLPEALHFGRSVRRIHEAGALENRLESGHG